jgi:2,5-diketo-D-gluconate reductase A
MTVPTIRLNDRYEIPQLGFGVYQVTEDAERIVSEAIEAGYRHIDTAALYGNEVEVGRAIRASGIPREEFYVTTKLWNTDQGTQEAFDAFDLSFEKLGLDYVDLYLIHWPQPELDRYVESWRALETIRSGGRVRSIGVSNFKIPELERLFAETDTVPVINQIKLHPGHAKVESRAFCAEHGIAVESWGPLGQGRVDLAAIPSIAAAASAHGVTPAQVVLRWHLQHGLVVIPKTVSKARMAENIDVFGFELGHDEMAAIDAIPEDS